MSETRSRLRRLGTLAASLAVATLLWLVVRNLDKLPAEFRVPITYDHPTDLVKLPGYPAEADVRILATKAKMRTLQAAELGIHVRNATGRAGTEVVVIGRDDVSAPFGVVITEVRPAQFTVSYDRAVTRSVPVRVDLRGTPAAGHEVAPSDNEVRPAQVEVRGPESLLTDDFVLRTQPVDVSDRTTPLTLPRLAFVPPGPAFEVRGPSSVAVTVRIQPRQGRASFDAVPVRVSGTTWVVTVNPRDVRVTVEGPEPSLRGLSPASVRVAVDTTGLRPQSDDYLLEPTVTIDQVACPACRVLALSQKRVNVHVKNRRSR